ncbi:DsrE family protein [Rhizobium sp. KVB221]|uniref:DsrE family protein n=1 Tax=Rhizobium setariae TaxID=2801340 RepID=A0A936YRD2_9HYPH|nr:DsrE family protein [Rhizobium setariae]MBL0371157.1 DsrE family protein [Rhizobium setariae]
MLFSRRSIFLRLLPGLAGGAAVSALPEAVGANTPVYPVQKVVYHLSEPTRVNFVMGNIKNHIDGKGGPEKVKIVLVIHGPALAAFRASRASPDLRRQTEMRAVDGVSFVACGNTLKALKLQTGDLLGKFDIADEGGVVRIADLQQQGYLYIRP